MERRTFLTSLGAGVTSFFASLMFWKPKKQPVVTDLGNGWTRTEYDEDTLDQLNNDLESPGGRKFTIAITANKD